TRIRGEPKHRAPTEGRDVLRACACLGNRTYSPQAPPLKSPRRVACSQSRRVTKNFVQARWLLLSAWIALPACSAHHASTAPPPPPDDARGDTVFRHPGVLVNAAQLEFVKSQIAAAREPWTSAFAKAKASPWASLSYEAKPRASVDCGSNSNPDFGC